MFIIHVFSVPGKEKSMCTKKRTSVKRFCRFFALFAVISHDVFFICVFLQFLHEIFLHSLRLYGILKT